MPIDFSKPQHQSVKGIVIMFADTLQNIIRGVWAPLLIVLYKFDWTKMLFLGLAVFVLLLIIGCVAYLKYKNFTFFLDENKEEFVIQKGIISKNKIIIQLEKIQQVNINQSVIQKLIGVYSVDIDTAGSQNIEVSIRAVDNDVALLLKDKLVSFEKANDDYVTSEENLIPEKPFLKISLLTLVKVGVTSNYGRSVTLILGFLVSLYGGFYDVSKSFKVDEKQMSSLVERGLAYFSLSFLIMIVFLLVLLINLTRTVVKNYDYQMVLQNKALAINFGLFAKKNTLLKAEKVQLTSFSQNFLQRKLNLFDIKLKQASSNDESDKDSKKAFIEVPGCNLSERDSLLKMILNEIVPAQEKLKPNFRFVLVSSFVGILLPVFIFLLLGFFVFQNLQAYFPVVPIYIILMSVVIYFKFLNYRLLLSKKQIIVKHNAWDVEHQILQPYKIQGITTKQYFWQKSADIVHLTFHTAAGDIGFSYGNYAQLKPWINYWLYEVERSERSWM